RHSPHLGSVHPLSAHKIIQAMAVWCCLALWDRSGEKFGLIYFTQAFSDKLQHPQFKPGRGLGLDEAFDR
ncbi:MAG: hypothetical protein ACFCVD_14340, partial [Nodosilinea sp.]